MTQRTTAPATLPQVATPRKSPGRTRRHRRVPPPGRPPRWKQPTTLPSGRDSRSSPTLPFQSAQGPISWRRVKLWKITKDRKSHCLFPSSIPNYHPIPLPSLRPSPNLDAMVPLLSLEMGRSMSKKANPYERRLGQMTAQDNPLRPRSGPSGMPSQTRRPQVSATMNGSTTILSTHF